MTFVKNKDMYITRTWEKKNVNISIYIFFIIVIIIFTTQITKKKAL